MHNSTLSRAEENETAPENDGDRHERLVLRALLLAAAATAADASDMALRGRRARRLHLHLEMQR